MKLIFLDIDGVLNKHAPHENGYCGIDPDNAAHLNGLLARCPDAMIAVSSAWRYHVHNGEMKLAGLVGMLMTHGINCHGRVHGVTDPDPETFDGADHSPPFDRDYWEQRGLRWRKAQIEEYVSLHNPTRYVVLDDLALAVSNLIKTERNVGLTAELAEMALALLESANV